MELTKLDDFVAYKDNKTLNHSSWEYARDRDMDILYPEANELFLDIDGEYWSYNFFGKLKELDSWLVANGMKIEGFEGWGSKTPGHYHVVVRLSTEVDEPTRIMLQMMLGSDAKRERFGLMRHMLQQAAQKKKAFGAALTPRERDLLNPEERPTMFFEKKGE